jgi:CheY-like chemotaxis protein
MNEHSLSVLLVDDDPHSQGVFELVMKHHNLPFVVVDDAETALEFLRTNSPDIVLMDIFLPGLDGYQALDRIRRMGGVEDTRIIATTAYYTHDTEQEVLRRGFDGYVAKPFDKNLINYLQSVLN